MTSKFRTAVLAMTIMAVLPVANANEHVDIERVIACASERDDARRLVCYDEAVADAKQPSREPAAETSAQVAATKPAAAQPAAPSPGAAAPVTPTPAPNSAPAPKAATDFGVTGSAVARQRQQELEQQRNESGKVERITAAVTAVSTKPHGELIITLDNGQVWAQKRKERYFAAKPGDKVTIDAGMLGSYRMVIGSRSTHVTRVK